MLYTYEFRSIQTLKKTSHTFKKIGRYSWKYRKIEVLNKKKHHVKKTKYKIAEFIQCSVPITMSIILNTEKDL